MSKFMSKKVLVAFIVLISVITAGLVIAASSIKKGNTVEVISSQKLLAGASTKAKVIATVDKGTTATVVTTQKDWANIKLTNSGIKGWVKVSALKAIQVKPQLTINSVSKISAEWLASGHGSAIEPLAYAGPRDGCIPCHSGNALERFGTDKQYKPSTGIANNTDAANKDKYSFMFDPHAAELPTQIGCATCHSNKGEAIMKSGIIPKELNIFDKTTDWNVGNKNALCLTCHNGRRDVGAIYKSWTTEGATKTTSYPHHAWGSLVTGKGGIQYPDATYAQSSMHQTLGCIGCHMGTAKEGYVSHEFKPSLDTCKKCHTSATSIEALLDNSNTKKEIETKLPKLRELVLAKIPGATEIGLDNSTYPVVGADGKKIDVKTISSVEALAGAYNYAVLKQEMDLGAKGAHNPKYALSLLNKSIERLEAAK